MLVVEDQSIQLYNTLSTFHSLVKQTVILQSLIPRGTLSHSPRSHLRNLMILDLRTTVPLVSYIRNSLRFWYYASLSTCCQNLEKKIGVTRTIWEKAGVKLLRDLTKKSVNFSTLATSNIRLLLVFGEDDR